MFSFHQIHDFYSVSLQQNSVVVIMHHGPTTFACPVVSSSLRRCAASSVTYRFSFGTPCRSGEGHCRCHVQSSRLFFFIRAPFLSASTLRPAAHPSSTQAHSNLYVSAQLWVKSHLMPRERQRFQMAPMKVLQSGTWLRPAPTPRTKRGVLPCPPV